MTSMRDLSKEQKQTAENNGINMKTLSSRLCKGWPVERAITELPQIRKGGMNYKGIIVTREQVDHAEIAGISRKTLMARLDRGWTVEEAISKPPRKLEKKVKQQNHTIDDKEVIEIIGRIKYLRKVDKEFPMPYPKPLLERLENIGYQVKDIKAIEV